MKKGLFLLSLLVLFLAAPVIVAYACDVGPPGTSLQISIEADQNFQAVAIASYSYEIRKTEGRAIPEGSLTKFPIQDRALIYTDNLTSMPLTNDPVYYKYKEDAYLLKTQFIKPVTKHGITDREAGFRQAPIIRGGVA